MHLEIRLDAAVLLDAGEPGGDVAIRGGDLEDPVRIGSRQGGENAFDLGVAPLMVEQADGAGRDLVYQDQLAAGGDSRRGMGDEWGHDDGGHLIAARFGGASTEENLIAQDSNFNRGSYKRMENDWANHINNGDKVFVHMETSQGERPDALMGYAIFEHQDGSRDHEYYSFLNESISQQEQWREGPDEYVDDDFAPTSSQADQGEGLGEDMDDDMGIE